eukprot:CAMPEP_0168556140 /NCGR_PEP_ID=MMETSP0413-20121227/8717_1 /TAXON_ID=136452 /ORGANISM="Filamoeba nolandi, Strain NC-AS-23-1" /LENGTH=169 /DNA_ID=CAMNT_0008587053 /DNA_START=25 /DNA_END=531 /DNA_ORIENTATION=+
MSEVISAVTGVLKDIITVVRTYDHAAAALIALLDKLDHQLCFFQEDELYVKLAHGTHSNFVKFQSNQFTSNLQEILTYLKFQKELLQKLSEGQQLKAFARYDLEKIEDYLRKRLETLELSAEKLVAAYEEEINPPDESDDDTLSAEPPKSLSNSHSNSSDKAVEELFSW